MVKAVAKRAEALELGVELPIFLKATAAGVKKKLRWLVKINEITNELQECLEAEPDIGKVAALSTQFIFEQLKSIQGRSLGKQFLNIINMTR
jgi:hypothetical protein